jgi:hypothetical protein
VRGIRSVEDRWHKVRGGVDTGGEGYEHARG